MDFNIAEVDEDAVLKEVWNILDIQAKTELNDSQIQSVNKLQTLATLFNLPIIQKHSEDFMILQKSRNRKSMQEFTDVVKAKRENGEDRSGFMGGLMGR